MERLIHLLIPRESNNHKAKLIQSSGLIVISAILILFQSLISYFPKIKPGILGFANQISREEVVRLTNQKRSEAGLPTLAFNETLSSAAYTKARDMVDRDYWAHVSPDGTQPWSFFTRFGYKYRYAGENLARDFSSAGAVVDAWMNSPTHRDNILNPKYKEIGIGITEGDLAGSDSTIVVQFFGTTYADNVSKPAVAAGNTTEVKKVAVAEPKTTTEEVKSVQTPAPEPTQVPVSVNLETIDKEVVLSSPLPEQRVLISPFNTTRTASLVVVGILIIVFMVDAFLVSKRRITRIAGRTFAHVVFLGMVLSIILILKSGRIM